MKIQPKKLFISIILLLTELINSKLPELIVIKSQTSRTIQPNQLNLYYSLQYQSTNYLQLQSQANLYCQQLNQHFLTQNINPIHFKIILSNIKLNKLKPNKHKLRYQTYIIIHLQIDLQNTQYSKIQQIADTYLQNNQLAFQYGKLCLVGEQAQQSKNDVIRQMVVDNKQQADHGAQAMGKTIIGVQKFKIKVINRCIRIPLVSQYAKQISFNIKVKGKYYLS